MRFRIGTEKLFLDQEEVFRAGSNFLFLYSRFSQNSVEILVMGSSKCIIIPWTLPKHRQKFAFCYQFITQVPISNDLLIPLPDVSACFPQNLGLIFQERVN